MLITMFRGRFFGALWKPKNPHSLDHLKYLYSVLQKNQVVNESNRSLLVESLRSIAEILIWGDQNDSTVFDFFLEKNMLSFFLFIMRQKCGSYVCVQLLQTLNILFENIRNETSIYYLLSNNHVNSIIVHKFDFSDEEVMAYYISFLKTLSLKLNVHTVQFFFNESTKDFPLYTETIKFFNHPESMVRIAARTLTLNVFKVDEKSMLKFVCDRTAVPYFSNLVWFIGNHVLQLDKCLRSASGCVNQNRLADLVAEHLDNIHYVNDILCLNIDELNQVLTEQLLTNLFLPLYVLPLAQSSSDENMLSPAVALFLLTQVFLIVNHHPLVCLLARVIITADSRLLNLSNSSEEGRLRVGHVEQPIPLSESLTDRSSPSSGSLSPPLSPSIAARGATSATDMIEMSTRTHTDTTSPTPDPTTTTPPSGTLRNQQQRAPCDAIWCHLSQLGSEWRGAVCAGDRWTGWNYTDEEKRLLSSRNTQLCCGDAQHADEMLTPSAPDSSSDATAAEPLGRPFLAAILANLDCQQTDYSALFALSLLYAMGHNSGVNRDLLESVLLPHRSDSIQRYNQHLADAVVQLIVTSCQPNSHVRLITLELAICVLNQLAIIDGVSVLSDHHLALIEGAKEQAILTLRNFYKSEEIFLDMFEDEQERFQRRTLNIEYLLMDERLLLPSAGSTRNSTDFYRRLPCGEIERARRAISVFLLVRSISLDVFESLTVSADATHQHSRLPTDSLASSATVASADDQPVRIGDTLDLNNSDLIACTVCTDTVSSPPPPPQISAGSGVNGGDRTELSSSSASSPPPAGRIRRFLVIDPRQMLLVDPDQRRLGWGLVRFAGRLQDVELSADTDDSRVLHITVRRPSSRVMAAAATTGSTSRDPPTSRQHAKAQGSGVLLSGRLMFDDHIRCMAARRKLARGRVKARQRKMHAIGRLLQLPGHMHPCPSPPPVLQAPGAVSTSSSCSYSLAHDDSVHIEDLNQ